MTCTVTSSQYLRQLGRMYLRDRWPWLAAPVLLCGAMAAAWADVRWLVVGLMLLFVAIPMVLALAYINYALSLEARWSLLNKELTITDQGLMLQFEDQRLHDRLITWSEVNRVEVGGNAFLVMLSVRRYTFLMIPFTAIEQASIPIRDFAAELYAHLQS